MDRKPSVEGYPVPIGAKHRGRGRGEIPLSVNVPVRSPFDSVAGPTAVRPAA